MKKIFKIALVAGAACLAGKLLLSAVAPKIDVTVVADRWDPDPDTGKDEDDAPVDSAEQNAAPEPEAYSVDEILREVHGGAPQAPAGP